MGKIHILGICGTFMGGLATLARELGYDVEGCDANVYPPMSTQLEQQGITLKQGYLAEHLQPHPDLVVIGNALSRGNPAVEYVLDQNIPYISGPQWLHDYLLKDRWVLAVAGTHGKTTTSSMLAWIMEYAGLKPGFLIGGIAQNFGISARGGEQPFFVVEADEYDSAFFDKRSKFVHYSPKTLIINNIEFDHADIFSSLGDIKKQFHHLVRIVPGHGLIIHPGDDPHVKDTLGMGCWTPTQTYLIDAAPDDDASWHVRAHCEDGSDFEIFYQGQTQGRVQWALTGEHNMRNAVAAVAAAQHAGVIAAEAIKGLCEFGGIKRRMELRGKPGGIFVYDDFAHHPTAIEKTLAGLRARHPGDKIVAVFEPRSNTMKMGVHNDSLAPSFRHADEVIWYEAPNLGWDLSSAIGAADIRVERSIEDIVKKLAAESKSGDHIVIMSNGGFGGIHEKLIQALQ